MKLRTLTAKDMDKIMWLFCRCFSDDSYYARMFPDEKLRSGQMSRAFEPGIRYCVEHDGALGVYDGDALAAFALWFDYDKVWRDDKEAFAALFSVGEGRGVPYEEELHVPILAMGGGTLFILSVAVEPAHRRQGLASALVDEICARSEGRSIASDISNPDSVKIYERRGFDVSEIDAGYTLVTRPAGRKGGPFPGREGVRLILPDESALDLLGINYGLMNGTRYLLNCTLVTEGDIKRIAAAPGEVCPCLEVAVSYEGLLEYQRYIGLGRNTERFSGEAVYYIRDTAYPAPPLFNDTLRSMLDSRRTEWSVVPDVFVSVPVSYADISRLAAAEADDDACRLLEAMAFRTSHEAGVPSERAEADDLSGVKKRIRRIYLGKLSLGITGEPTLGGGPGEDIGAPAAVDMYISVDTESRCGVLTWYALSAPFLISQLLDNVVRNRAEVFTEGGRVNIFDYLMEKYGVTKQGTAKSYVVIPRDRRCLSPEQTASLLASETIYPDGEVFGKIVDEEIMSMVRSERGMGQYDRATIYAHTNVALQFSPDLRGAITVRLEEESVTLFYIELILFEEAAIHIADRDMVRLASETSSIEPVRFLRRVESVYDEFSRTIDFWDIKVNYPTSRMSVSMLRRAFGIDAMLDNLHRDRDHLKNVFDTKCDIIDREDSRRMDTSLAVISVLAVFSAWIDGHDYAAAWGDVLSGGTVKVLQRAVFIIVLIMACYAVLRLVSGRLHRLFRRRK